MSASADLIIPPAHVITEHDQSGLIVVIATFFLASIVICLFVRLYIRLTINGPWRSDDSCVAAATLLSIGRSAAVFVSVSDGYGRSRLAIEQPNYEAIGKSVLASTILYYLAMLLSKTAVVFLCQRLTPNRVHNMILHVLQALCVAWVVMAILLVTINCAPGRAWDSYDLSTHCSNIAARLKTICAIDIFTEVLIFACAIYIVIGTRMTIRLKAIVALAFGVRLPTIAFAAVRLASLLKEIRSSDPTLNGAYTSVWTQVELDYSIVACTLSLLGAFLKPFTEERGASNSYQLGSLSSTTQSKRRSALQNLGGGMTLRPDEGENEATVTRSRSRERKSWESEGSQKGIVKKVQWSVARAGENENENGEGTSTRLSVITHVSSEHVPA